MKVLIFGISGNPIHLGHIDAANSASSWFDEVWMMPSNASNSKELISCNHRLQMTNLAIEENNNPKIKVFDYLIKNDIKESTYYLMSRLKVEYDYDFYFMIGTDNVEDIKNWINYEKLVEEVKFFIIERKGYNKCSSNLDLFQNFIYLKSNTKEVNSTEIRNKLLTQDEFIDQFLNKSVFEYIIANKLYGT